VTQDLHRAGAQRQCVELALGLHRLEGWRVEVLALEPGGALADELDEAGIARHLCSRRWRWDLFPARGIAALTRRSRHDIVHSYLFLPNFYCRIARLLHRTPVLISSLRSTGIDGRLRYAAEALMAPLCDAIIANSDAGSRGIVALGVSPRRVFVVRNGLDLSRFEKAAATQPEAGDKVRLLGMIAQMEPRKDHLGLVEAYSKLRLRFPHARLVLAGDGSRRLAVETRIRQLGLEGEVMLLGTVDRPEQVLETLDIYIQASAREEGTSNSILEAMAAGRPVVATDVGGNREVVRHGVTGLIVPPHDPEALASALSEMLADPGRCRRMGAAGATLVREQYSRQAMVDATVAVYQTVFGRESRDRVNGG
jgi:glycosyltransferase involved in cell wall biosynthesis